MTGTRTSILKGPLLRWPLLGKLEERLHRHPEALSHLLQGLEGRSVDAALDQAEEVNGDPHEFGEALLRELALLP